MGEVTAPGCDAASALSAAGAAGAAAGVAASAATAVTGATGGVGSIAVDMLDRAGFEVTAISGKADQVDFLHEIGAKTVMNSKELLADRAPLSTPTLWAAALDNVGGEYFDRVSARMHPYGKIAVAGMAVGAEVSTTVLPWILRAVDVLGINVSRQLAMDERRRLWGRMATDLKPRHFDKIARPISFEALDEAMDKFFNVTTIGRVVVEVGEKAPAKG